jgi:hypothetical protein
VDLGTAGPVLADELQADTARGANDKDGVHRRISAPTRLLTNVHAMKAMTSESFLA